MNVSPCASVVLTSSSHFCVGAGRYGGFRWGCRTASLEFAVQTGKLYEVPKLCVMDFWTSMLAIFVDLEPLPKLSSETVCIQPDPNIPC